MPTAAIEHAIADLKAQFEKAVAPWRKASDPTAESVRVKQMARGRWLFWLHTSRCVELKLDPPHVLWIGNKKISTKAAHLSLMGARYWGEHLLVFVESPHAETFRGSEPEWLLSLHIGPTESASELFEDPVRKVAAKRSWRALTRVLSTATVQDVEDVASQSSDLAVVVRALEQPEAIETLTEDDPFAAARLRGVRERERLLSEEGGTWTVEDVAKHIHVTRQTVNLRRKQGTLLGLDAGRHGFHYPAWQFTRNGTVDGLEPTLAALKHLDPWMQQAFMLGRNARLRDKRPIDLLRAGHIAQVVKAASAFGEHGAA